MGIGQAEEPKTNDHQGEAKEVDRFVATKY
jgi:hypothetical protein